MPADDLRGIPSSVIWGVTAVIVAICIFGFDSWDTARRVIESHGASIEDAQLLGFVAYLTLPLTVGTAIIVFGFLIGLQDRISLYWSYTLPALVLLGAAKIASEASLGLPLKEPLVQVSDGGIARPLLLALSMYLSSYGFPLMIASIVIGVALAIQVAQWI
jgi:hypothetical protein